MISGACQSALGQGLGEPLDGGHRIHLQDGCLHSWPGPPRQLPAPLPAPCPGARTPGGGTGVASFSSLGLDTYSGPFCRSVLVKSRWPRERGRGRTCPNVGERERTRGCVHLAADPSRALRVAEGAPSPPSAPSSSLLTYKVSGTGLDLVPHGVLSASCSPHPGNLASCVSAPARRTLGFQGSALQDQLVAPGGTGRD